MVPHSVENGVILPPVNIYTVPKVTEFQPCSLSEPLLAPAKTPAQEKTFIFTPIQSDSSNRGKVGICFDLDCCAWSCTYVISHSIIVLGDQLGSGWNCKCVFCPCKSSWCGASDLRNWPCSMNGAEFEAFPSAHVLPAHSGPVRLQLTGLPKIPGLLNLLGYTCVVFGVKSNCRLKSLGLELDEDFIRIEVCPRIPRLEKNRAGWQRKRGEESAPGLGHLSWRIQKLLDLATKCKLTFSAKVVSIV